MEPTDNGFDKLLYMPHGDAEETVIVLARAVFVTNYLSVIYRLTSDKDEQALHCIIKGNVFILCDWTVTSTTDNPFK